MSDRNLMTFAWWGYFSCAVIYTIAGLRAGDWLSLTGSFLFLAATAAFLVLHYRNPKRAPEEGNNQ